MTLPEPSADPDAKRILIAEDEPFILESLTFLLTRAGYQVESCRDGRDALGAMISRQPALLILDIMMPGLNGFEVLRQMRATPRLGTLPVLVLTAKGQEIDRRRVRELGAQDFLAKPFGNRDLLDRVQSLLSPARPGAEAEAAGP